MSSRPNRSHQYRQELVEIDSIRLAEDAGARHHKRDVHRMQQAYLALRQSAEGRAAISELIDDPVPTVALWAATQAAFWDESKARGRHASFVDGHRVHASEARVTLREFDAGRLNTDWQPEASLTEGPARSSARLVMVPGAPCREERARCRCPTNP